LYIDIQLWLEIKTNKMELEDLNIYTLAMELGETVWEITNDWNFFQKDTIGKQLVRSADSVSANISERYGRYSYKETINLYETKTWLTKAHNRCMIEEELYQRLIQDIKNLGIKLNNYITTLKSKSQKS
jgi:four helix bundle protein